VQWRFDDADPWYVVVKNGATKAEHGEAAKADVTLRSTWGDWVNISKGAIDPRRAVLSRRLRIRGKPRGLLGFARAFPRRGAPVA
jgi:putative sterol carrier protein